ncbi:hypothetical protein [Pseudonocardia endophytica]|uniref:Uncharacterized protein n=1 Tax=Pseudonocardia endophytica TaxID=401976 RepID=A0A4R1HHW0_PSEEN|nr:hypothetical protein [Pseudonocardia endophytica]TCK20025.1 hypothetical protein EV378_3973 [Pseudonocardia endophytica]
MTVPQQRSQQQPWPSTVTQQRTLPPHAQQRIVPPAAHRADSGRAPVAQPAQPAVDGSLAMTILRTTTYVLTSIASLLFILLVIYGAVKVNQLQDAFSSSPFGSSYSSSSY